MEEFKNRGLEYVDLHKPWKDRFKYLTRKPFKLETFDCFILGLLAGGLFGILIVKIAECLK